MKISKKIAFLLIKMASLLIRKKLAKILAKVLANPEMAALLASLAKTMK